MENITSPETASQARKTVREAQKLGADLRVDVDDAVARGRAAAEEAAADVAGGTRSLSDRARPYAQAARRNAIRAAGKMSDYADANTAVVVLAAFGAGLLLGHLVSRGA